MSNADFFTLVGGPSRARRNKKRAAQAEVYSAVCHSVALALHLRRRPGEGRGLPA